MDSPSYTNAYCILYIWGEKCKPNIESMQIIVLEIQQNTGETNRKINK